MEKHALGTGWDEDLTNEDLDIRLARLKDRASRSTPIEDADDLEDAIEQAADKIAARQATGKRDRPPAAVIHCQVSLQASGLPGHSIKVVFTADQACVGVQVRMMAFPGETVPVSAPPSDGVPILDTTLTLEAGVPAAFTANVPQAVRRPFWIRCFIVNEQTIWRIDPPITSLKGA